MQARSWLHNPSRSLQLRQKGNKFFRGEETFFAGLPESLEGISHEPNIGPDYCINVDEKAQLLCVGLPVPIQGRILVPFCIVKTVD